MHFDRSEEGLWVPSVFDQASSQVATLKVSVGIHRVYNPELIARTTDGDVVPFFENILRTRVSEGQLPVVWGPIYHRKKDDITFVTLELRRVAA